MMHKRTLLLVFSLLFTVSCSVVRAQTPAGAAESLTAQVNWSHDVEAALKKANQSGQLIFMKFTAKWCGYCHKMEKETFTRPAIAGLVNQNFVPVLVDADQYKDLVKHLQIRGLPAMLVVSPDMVILERISGYQTEEKLLPQLKAIVAKNHTPKSTTIAVASPTQSAFQDGLPLEPQPSAVRPVAFNGPAFGGLCLAGVRETRSLISGTPLFAKTYRGRTLHFSSQEQLLRFEESPEKYWPQNDGVCPVTLVERGAKVEGKLEFAAMFRNQLWVTQDAGSMKKFVAEPARYVDALQK